MSGTRFAMGNPDVMERTMVIARADEKFEDLVRSVRACLVEEERLEAELAASKAGTGEALMRLEEHCKSLGVNHSEMIAHLREDADAIAVERLTEASVRNRKRLARMKQKFPKGYLPFILPLKVGAQRAMMRLTPERVGEFIARGCPVHGGAVPLKRATRKQMAYAVDAAETTIADELVILADRPPEVPREPDRFWELVQAFGNLDRLTLEQAEQLLSLMVPLVALDPAVKSWTTTRKPISLQIGLAKEDAPVIEALKVLDALAPWLKHVDFGKLSRLEMRDVACALLVRIFAAIAGWYAPTLRETG